MSILSAVMGLGGTAVKVGAGLLGPRLYIEAAVAAVLLAAIGAQTWRLHTEETKSAKAELATQQALSEWNKQVAEGTRVAFVEAEKNRAITADLQRKKDEAEHARQVDRTNAARVAAGFAAERAGMRSQLAAFAAPGGSGLAVDTVAACRERATALGGSLDESLRAEEDLTDALEGSRSDARSLLNAWPRSAAGVTP